MKIFIDGNEVKPKCDVRIVYEDVEVPDEENGQVHFVFSNDGAVVDVWVPDAEEIERSVGRQWLFIEDIVGDIAGRRL